MSEENVTMNVIEEQSAPTPKDFLSKLKEGKTFSEKTFNLYMNNLNRLNGGPVKNLNFLKDVEAVSEKISKFKPNTQRTYYIGIVSILKNNPKFKKQFQLYYDKMMDLNKVLKTNVTKSETQEKNWIEQNEVSEIQRALEGSALSILNGLKKNAKLNEPEFNQILNWVVLSLYTLQPPRRNADYQFCYVVKKFTADLPNNVNYYDMSNGTFYLNNYKTAKAYHQQEIKAPEELVRVIATYLTVHPLKNELKKKGGIVPLLVSSDGEPFDKINSITRILNKIFGKRVGVSLLRNVYLTDKYGDKVKSLEADGEAMGTSSNTILNNYVKVD